MKKGHFLMTRLRCVASLLVGMPAALVAGCSSSSSPASPQADASPEPGADVAASTTDGSADAGSTSVSLAWKVTFIAALAGNPPASDGGADAEAGEGGLAEAAAADGTGDVSGMQVCAYEDASIPCVTTDATGAFMLPSVPVRTNLALTVNKAGYLPIVVSIQTASTAMDETASPIFVYPLSTEQAWTQPVPGTTADMQNKGSLGEAADGLAGGAPGAIASMSMQADGAAPTGTGALYMDTTSVGNPGFAYGGVNYHFTASAAGFPDNGAGIGFAGFFNIDPGTYTVITTDTTADCEPVLMPFAPWGFPIPEVPHAVQVLVLKGYFSEIVSSCTMLHAIVPVDGG
jgi:hypothetical protein